MSTDNRATTRPGTRLWYLGQVWTTLRQSRRRAVVLAIGLGGLGGDCSRDVLNDATFRDWCGDTLCSWTVNTGHIARVPTWDAGDLGVSFLDKGAQISQVTTESSTSDSNAGCILFTSVANVDPTAQFTLEVDFDDDGTIDYVWTVPATQWQRVQVQITAPPAYDGIRFILTKGGTGNAVLAEMRAQTTTGCTAAPVPMPALSLGEPCTSDGDCSSGICAIALFCVGCSGPATVCSQCDYGRPCSAGEKCTGREYPTLASMPLQCAPGLNRGASGAECIADNDCESGQCTGAIATAPQASAAGGPPGPCDLDSVDVGPDNCVQYAVHGGKCN